MFMFHHMFYACAWLVFPCLVYSCCVCIHMSVACIYMRGSKCELRHFLCESTLSNHVDISSKIIARAREILISSINNWKLAIKITWLLAQKSLSRKKNNWNILPELYRCTPPELYYYIISWIRQDIFFSLSWTTFLLRLTSIKILFGYYSFTLSPLCCYWRMSTWKSNLPSFIIILNNISEFLVPVFNSYLHAWQPLWRRDIESCHNIQSSKMVLLYLSNLIND